MRLHAYWDTVSQKRSWGERAGAKRDRAFISALLLVLLKNCQDQCPVTDPTVSERVLNLSEDQILRH